MSPEEIFYIVVPYICIALFTFNCILFTILILKFKVADPTLWALFFLLNFFSALDSFFGYLYVEFSILHDLKRAIRINYVIFEWVIFLIFYYTTESKVNLMRIIKYLIAFSIISSFLIFVYNYYYSKYNDLYYSDFKFFTIVPLAIYRLFEMPQHSKTKNNFITPNFFLNVAIFQVMVVNYCFHLFRLTLYNLNKDIYFINGFILWFSYFAFFIILMIAFSKYPKKNNL
jgi:hypothetical protein